MKCLGCGCMSFCQVSKGYTLFSYVDIDIGIADSEFSGYKIKYGKWRCSSCKKIHKNQEEIEKKYTDLLD